MVNGWKVTAIILIVIVLLETSFIVYAYNIGTKEIDGRLKCSNVICYNMGSESFTYEQGICNCWKGDKIIYKEIIR